MGFCKLDVLGFYSPCAHLHAYSHDLSSKGANIAAMWKYATILFAALALFFALRPTTLEAQQGSNSLVFVNTAELFRAHPAGQSAAEVQQRARDELNQLAESLSPLAQKISSGQPLSAEERDSYDLLRRSIQSTEERYRQEFEQAAAPAQADIQAAIDAVAQENSYNIIMDGNVAGQAGIGLVVYAEEGLDITPLVVRRIR